MRASCSAWHKNFLNNKGDMMASSDYNNVGLIGRLTKDPELRHTQTGTAVAGFSLAVNRVWSQNGEKKEHCSFFNCTAWGKLGELIAQYCKKGDRVALHGRIEQRTWDDANGGGRRSAVEVVADTVQFLSTKKDGENQSTPDVPPEDNNGCPF